MSDKIKIQRVAFHKHGWKMRFGLGELIATVTLLETDLAAALNIGARIAKERFDVMTAFNQP